MTVKSVLAAAAFATSVMGTSPASAVLQQVNVDVLSYDMLNGSGVASSFYGNYWDGAYGGPGATGNPFADHSPLAGGKGILTDGVIPTLRWDNFTVTPLPGYNNNPNNPGPGQYVGWHTPTIGDPTIIFHLGGEPTITLITLYVDASNNGLVGAPSSVWVNGVQYTPTANWTVDSNCPDSWETGANNATCAQKLTISGSWTTNLFNIKPVHGEQPWIFLSEVQFATNAVPEPSTWIMMLLGFAGVGYAAYRRKPKANPVAV